jgi:hypothetical protein
MRLECGVGFGRVVAHVRGSYVPTPVSGVGLFDHLVGTGEQRCWNFEAACIRHDESNLTRCSTGISVPRASPQAPLMALAG